MYGTMLDLYKVAANEDGQQDTTPYVAGGLAGLGAAGFGGYQAYNTKKELGDVNNTITKTKNSLETFKSNAKQYGEPLNYLAKRDRYIKNAERLNKHRTFLSRIKDFVTMKKRTNYNKKAKESLNQANKSLRDLGKKRGMDRALTEEEARNYYNYNNNKIKSFTKNLESLSKDKNILHGKLTGYGALATLGLGAAGYSGYKLFNSDRNQ